jgi:DNA mismatch repair protein MutS
MKQYARFKTRHPDCVLFFRMGDFYEMFDADALLASRVLGITLTRRTEGIPMAGVPHHSADTYIRRMIEAGHRVAVCDQVQDPSQATGLVDRAVTRVLTPGTLVDEPLLDEARCNHVAAVAAPCGGRAVIAAVELSTGAFTLHEAPAERLLDAIVRLAPAELLYAPGADGTPPAVVESARAATGCAVTPRPEWSFGLDDARECLLSHFGVATVEGFGLEDDDPAVCAAGAVLRYLLETQTPDGADRPRRLGHLRPPRREPDGRFVTLDAATLANLEIERTLRRGTQAGSLLSTFGRCRTAMGRRLLRTWLCFPLRDRSAIEARLDAVEALVADRPLAETLARRLAGVQDVARITGRIAMGRATPRDLVALGASLEELHELAALLEGRRGLADMGRELRRLAGSLDGPGRRIRQRCVEAPPSHLREGGLFRDGVDATLDQARTLERDASSWLAAYQSRLVAETGIGSLRVGYNRVFGYYIEITHTHAAKVPSSFARRQTLKNAERYVTPQLEDFQRRITTATAEAITREKELFEELCAETAGVAGELTAFAELVGALDVLACFAEVALRRRQVRPRLADEPLLEIRAGRHPVLDLTLEERFVPNDCALRGAVGDRGAAGDAPGGDGAALALITGPNMAGKSTYIRQVALIVLLAHAGSFVPAEAATIGLADRIFTRIGASDELHAGRSTFMVEMTETANILHHATGSSVVILDEIGRGTSTLDGLSLAWAIAESLAERRCRTLFATHYHELTALADRIPGVANLHVSVREWGDRIVFLYRILPGRTDRSYGIHVARIAGLPRRTVDRAAALLETLAVQTVPGASEPPPSPGAQMCLFREYLEHPALETLRRLRLESMSPLEAFDALRRLRQEVDAPAAGGGS